VVEVSKDALFEVPTTCSVRQIGGTDQHLPPVTNDVLLFFSRATQN
jgi:hypothetical protein